MYSDGGNMGLGKIVIFAMAVTVAALLGLAACGGGSNNGVANPYGYAGGCNAGVSNSGMQSVTGTLYYQGGGIPAQANTFTLIMTPAASTQFGSPNMNVNGTFCMNWVDFPYLVQGATATTLTATSQGAGQLFYGSQITMSLIGSVPLPPSSYYSNVGQTTVNIPGDGIQGGQLMGSVLITIPGGRQFYYSSQMGYGH